MHKLNHAFILLFLFLLASCETKTEQANYQIIPLPQEIKLTDGTAFVISNSTQIAFPEGNTLLQRNAQFLSQYINEITGKKLAVTSFVTEKPQNAIVLGLDEVTTNNEGYQLIVNGTNVSITGKTEAGVFYGIQTLRKSLPIAKNVDISLPAVQINDYPRFKYRGMHLDVGRHFFSADFVKTYIDMLALHNINNFHWHLTEDQGWRIEIKKYPNLTEVGSVRKKTVIGRNSDEYDETPYGGFYSQEEIKDVVAYAAERFVNVIPEIDLPGHMLAALTAYPQYGCTGGPYEVEPTWGVFPDIICIGNDDAMKFLEDVLDEVVQLFPSEYIHIGGDEAPRDRWKVCPKCQARIKAEGLKADSHHTAEDRLQSYCMERMEKFLNSKGRRIIGWDEILEGDIAPNATVMSWRGTQGGIEAAKLGHDVIMAPNGYAYLDYYQTDDLTGEPLGIGGYVPIEKVYSLEPAPDDLTEEQKKYIIGAQANLWTEYIPTFEHVQYMVLPRMSALSEVQWTMPEKKNYEDFATRLPHMMGIYDVEGYNYAKHVYDLKATFTPRIDKSAMEVELTTIDDAPIYYTLDGSEPTKASSLYQGPVLVTESADFRAAAIREAGSSRVKSETIRFNKATMKPVTLLTQPHRSYTFEGGIILVDGLTGAENFASGRWLGFHNRDAEMVIDLGQPTEISKVTTNANIDINSWIMGPAGITIAISDDNNNFKEIASQKIDEVTDLSQKNIEHYEVSFAPVQSQYVKVTIKASKGMPKTHSGAGQPAFLFIDEIVIE